MIILEILKWVGIAYITFSVVITTWAIIKQVRQ